jgi:hypothetical protein
MVERKPSKLHTWVRFPSPAPFSFNNLHSCAGKVQENWTLFKLIFPKNGGEDFASAKSSKAESLRLDCLFQRFQEKDFGCTKQAEILALLRMWPGSNSDMQTPSVIPKCRSLAKRARSMWRRWAAGRTTLTA